MEDDPPLSSEGAQPSHAEHSSGHEERKPAVPRSSMNAREVSSREYRSKTSRLLWGMVYRVLVFLETPLEIISVLFGDYLVIRAFRYLMTEELTRSPRLAYAAEVCQISIAFLVLLTVVVHLLHSVWVLGRMHIRHGRGNRE